MYYVALLLTLMWGLSYLLVKKNLCSGRIYFYILFAMSIPSFFEPNFLNKFIEGPIDYTNIFILGFLLLLGFIPWYYFDKHYGHQIHIVINQGYITNIKVIFLITIIGSLFSILYLSPYAIRGIVTGALDMREYIQEESPLPKTFATTIAVGFANIHIFAILFFYISYLSDELKRYRILLFISSFSYIISCMAITARDGLIILPLFYVIFYLIFRSSISSINKTRIKIALFSIAVIIIIFMTSFTLSRFWGQEQDTEFLQEGTIGYIAQQPYVFNVTVQEQTDFHGWELRFPLINRLIGVGEHEVYRLDTWYETCFGTMYADFYNIGGWYPVIGVLLVFILYYWWALSLCHRNDKPFGMLLIFTVYLYIALTGMFYCRAGSAVSMNIFYIAISILPLFIGNYININTPHVNNRYPNYKV